MVHVGTTHVGLARMEINDHVAPFPLVGGVPLQRGPIRMLLQRSGGHRSSFGRDHPIPEIDIQVQSIHPSEGCFSPCVQDQKARFLSGHRRRRHKARRQDPLDARPKPHPPRIRPILSGRGSRTVPSFGLEFPKLRALKVAGVESRPEIVGANLTHITADGSLNPQH